jgi:hypothetical protein
MGRGARPDLLDGRILARYYRPETLGPQIARGGFVLEERVPRGDGIKMPS